MDARSDTVLPMSEEAEGELLVDEVFSSSVISGRTFTACDSGVRGGDGSCDDAFGGVSTGFAMRGDLSFSSILDGTASRLSMKIGPCLKMCRKRLPRVIAAAVVDLAKSVGVRSPRVYRRE